MCVCQNEGFWVIIWTLSIFNLFPEFKREILEKKKEWAENFLKSFYKLQELKEKEKKKLELLSSLSTDDMKPFVNVGNTEDNDDEDPESLDELPSDRIEEIELEPQHREIHNIDKEIKNINKKLSGFQTHDEFR